MITDSELALIQRLTQCHLAEIQELFGPDYKLSLVCRNDSGKFPIGKADTMFTADEPAKVIECIKALHP